MTAGVNRDLNGEQIVGISVGAVTDLAGAWISVGGHGDLFTSNGYFGGRLTGITQLNVVRRPHLRVFGLGGLSLGVIDGPVIGVGLEVRQPERRVGFRVVLEDHLARVSGFDCGYFGVPEAECRTRYHGGQPHAVHQQSLQVGVTWH